MRFCSKCSAELKENAKFCAKCGAKVKDYAAVQKTVQAEKSADAEDSAIKSPVPESKPISKGKSKPINTGTKKGSNSKLIKLIVTISLIFLICGAGIFTYYTVYNKQTNNNQISLKNFDIGAYPTVKINLNITGFKNGLDVNNFSIKENDTSQNNLRLSKDGTNFVLEYTTTDSETSSQKNVTVQYSYENKNYSAKGSYTPSKTDEKDSTSSDSTISKAETEKSAPKADSDEESIKSCIDNYESSFIRMVNENHLPYITSVLDDNSPLHKEFEGMIKDYSSKGITENLEDYKITSLKKVNDTQYEVNVYEKFLISYGSTNETKTKEFDATYLLNKTSSGFKVHSITNYNQK